MFRVIKLNGEKHSVIINVCEIARLRQDDEKHLLVMKDGTQYQLEDIEAEKLKKILLSIESNNALLERLIYQINDLKNLLRARL